MRKTGKTPRSRVVSVEGWSCEPVGFLTAAEVAEAWELPSTHTWDGDVMQSVAWEIAHMGLILVPCAGAQMMVVMAPLRADEIADN